MEPCEQNKDKCEFRIRVSGFLLPQYMNFGDGLVGRPPGRFQSFLDRGQGNGGSRDLYGSRNCIPGTGQTCIFKHDPGRSG